MSNGSIAGAIIMAISCFGCALTFVVIAHWAKKSKKPVNFWSGTKVPADKVTDVMGYNRANATMWSIYSVPYWLAGLIGCFGFMDDVFMMASAIILSISCFPGMFLLIAGYRKIERTYLKH